MNSKSSFSATLHWLLIILINFWTEPHGWMVGCLVKPNGRPKMTSNCVGSTHYFFSCKKKEKQCAIQMKYQTPPILPNKWDFHAFWFHETVKGEFGYIYVSSQFLSIVFWFFFSCFLISFNFYQFSSQQRWWHSTSPNGILISRSILSRFQTKKDSIVFIFARLIISS